MKLSVCEVCGQLLHFEHSARRRCGAPLAFIPGTVELTALIELDPSPNIVTKTRFIHDLLHEGRGGATTERGQPR